MYIHIYVLHSTPRYWNATSAITRCISLMQHGTMQVDGIQSQDDKKSLWLGLVHGNEVASLSLATLFLSALHYLGTACPTRSRLSPTLPDRQTTTSSSTGCAAS